MQNIPKLRRTKTRYCFAATGEQSHRHSGDDSGELCQAGIGKVTGKDDEEGRADGDQTTVKTIGQKTSAPGYGRRDNRIPDKVG